MSPTSTELQCINIKNYDLIIIRLSSCSQLCQCTLVKSFMLLWIYMVKLKAEFSPWIRNRQISQKYLLAPHLPTTPASGTAFKWPAPEMALRMSGCFHLSHPLCYQRLFSVIHCIQISCFSLYFMVEGYLPNCAVFQKVLLAFQSISIKRIKATKLSGSYLVM